MTENAIQPYDAKEIRCRQLGSPAYIRSLMGMDEVIAPIIRACQGENTGEKVSAARNMLEQVSINFQNQPSKLQQILNACTVDSVVQSIASLAALRLSPVKALNEAYFIPFGHACTLMVGYRGFIKLITNTGVVSGVEAVLVYKGEEFKFWRDENGPHIYHVPDISLQGDVSQVVAGYAIGYNRMGPPSVIAMSRAELDKVRSTTKQRNKGHESPAWKMWPDQMQLKTLVRRLQKWIPQTGDAQALDLLANAIQIDNDHFIDVEATEGQVKESSNRRLAAARGEATQEPHADAESDDRPGGGPEGGQEDETPPAVDLVPLKRALLEEVAEWRGCCESTLGDGAFIVAVCHAELHAPMAESAQDIEILRNAILVDQKYDRATGKLISDQENDE